MSMLFFFICVCQKANMTKTWKLVCKSSDVCQIIDRKITDT